ncbi:MAG: hypothetical protein H7A23_16985 [Leptospiraceae bacterium]|nr:hypothetical protein [Leptospiraceae bacterium]MCP5496243.1 hypothetical protein [Leptospiraceae bacterium]
MMKIFVVLFLIIFCSCASTDVNHLATTNWVDRQITPDSNMARNFMIPIYIPVCITTLVVDNFIIAPSVHFPDSLRITKNFITADLDGYYTNMATAPFRIVLAPVVFVSYWLSSTVFSFGTDNWPEWGYQWKRDEDGILIEPEELYNPDESSNDLFLEL